MLCKYLLTLPLMVLLALGVVMPAKAQDYISPDEYYKPVTKRDLDYNAKFLARRDGVSGSNSGFNSFNSGCPDEINIGGIGNNTRVIGSVNIDVNIDENFRINCGGR